MNSLLYYYNNVQKMAAYRQAKRLQRGVKLGYEQSIMSASTTKFVSAPISIGISDFSIEFYGNTYGSYTNKNPSISNQSQPYTYGEGCLLVYQTESGVGGIEWIIFEKPATGADLADSINLRYKPIDPIEKFHFVITRQGTTVKVYINGELKTTKEQSEVKDMGDLQLAIANSSEVGFVRVWNMCLSADDVTEHYNNGDPMGYVVPKAMRDLSPIQITGVNTYTWTGPGDVTEFRVTSSPRLQYLHKYRVNISVSDYQSGNPYLYAGSVVNIPASNGTYDVELEVSDAQYIFVTMYGGRPGSDRRLTLTVNSITPVGLLAEYLPQNLMESRKGPEVEPTAETFEFNASDENYKRVISIAYPPYTSVYRVDYIVDEWNYDPAPIDTVGFGFSFNAKYLSGTYKWQTFEAAKIGELQSFVFEAPSGNAPEVGLYAALNDAGAITRRLKVTIVGITPVSIPSSWLDSAKQLPLSDEYMEPLFQSIGGYDMAANGAPEILYYGPKPNSKGVTLSVSPLKAVGVTYTPPISGDMSIQLFAYDDKAISDQTITLMGGAIGNTDMSYQLMVFGYEDGYVLSILASGHRLGDVIIGQQGVFSEDIILAVDNSNIRVYANGDFKGNIDTSGYNITLDTIVLTGDAKVTSLFRVFNKALTAEEVAALHNNGNPDAYVLPASMKQGDQRCVLEWLPANIIPDKNNPSTASEWLDTATVLPEDNVQPKITQSVGGYDGTFQGNPTIVY